MELDIYSKNLVCKLTHGLTNKVILTILGLRILEDVIKMLNLAWDIAQCPVSILEVKPHKYPISELAIFSSPAIVAAVSAR